MIDYREIVNVLVFLKMIILKPESSQKITANTIDVLDNLDNGTRLVHFIM